MKPRLAGNWVGASSLGESRRQLKGLVLVFSVRLLLLGLSFALRLGSGLGSGPLFALRLTSGCFRLNVPIWLHVVVRLITWLVFPIGTVHFVRTRLVWIVRRSCIPVSRLVTVHVVGGRSHVPIFRTVTIRVVGWIYVPILRRGHISVCRTVRVHVIWTALVPVVRLGGARSVGSASCGWTD